MKRPNTGRRDDFKSTMKSMTDQSFREDTNIMSILAKLRKGHSIKFMKESAPVYMDLSATPDLQGAFAIVEYAKAAFAELPAVIRDRLGNNPANLEDFVINPENRDLLIEYGLLTPKETSETNVSVVTPKATKAKPKASTPPPSSDETET